MNLLRAASTISLFTLASRVSGLLRDIAVSSVFGAGASFDAFNVAFRIPNLLRRLFGEGAFSQAFVPTLARVRAAEGDEATHRLIDAVATVLFGALVLTCIAGIAAAPVVVWLMASGLERFDQATVMTRIMFPYIGFISLVSLSAGILNTWKRFAVPAATPVLLNLAMIAAVWWLAPYFARLGIEKIYALAAGVMLAECSSSRCRSRRWRVWACCRGSAPACGPGATPGAIPAFAPSCARWRRRCSASRWRSCRS